MNWSEAVAAMKHGERMRRAREEDLRLVSPGDDLNPPVYVVGTEPMFLAAAWTDDDRPVSVFMGAWSGVPFVPDDEHRAATDWVPAQ